MLTLAIYDYGRYFMLSQLVNNAAREGARQAVANTNTQNTAMIQNTVDSVPGDSQNLTDTSGKAFSRVRRGGCAGKPGNGRGNVARQQLVRRCFRVEHHGSGQGQVYSAVPDLWISCPRP